MTWGRRFQRYEGFLESLWVVPAIGAALGGILGIVVAIADDHVGAPSFLQYSPSTASAVLAAIVGAAAALTGFVVTVTVLVVQMAMGSFSARVMRLWYRDPLLKLTLAVLVGTLTFSFSLLRRIDDDFVPDLGVTLAGLLISVSLLFFVVFFDRCIRRLRPVAIAADVASTARSTFEEVVRFADRPDIRWAFATTGQTRRSSYGPAAPGHSRRLIRMVSSSGHVLMTPSWSCLTRLVISCKPAEWSRASTAATSAIMPPRSSRE